VTRTVLYYATTVVSTSFFSTLAVIGGLVRAPHAFYDWIHRNWAGSILRAAGVRVEVEGLEHSERGRGQIVIANHQSMFDIWALMAGLPASIRFIAKGELARIPIFAHACRAAGHVFIDRKNSSQAAPAIREAGERMRREGLTLVLFAEGTRSPDGELKRFRRGSFALAIETQTVLLPVAIDGGGRILSRAGRRVHPGPIRIRIAPGVPLAGMTAQDRDPLLASTHETVRRMLAELREGGAGAEPSSSLAPEPTSATEA